MNKMTQAELQNIEHATHILQEHQRVVEDVVNQTEAMLNTYGPILRTYVDGIVGVQKVFGEAVVNIVRSTRELKLITGGTQNIHDFCSAVIKLDGLLTPELIEKLKGVIQ